ncbi:YycH family regulatory protein [Alteribacter populi]|uniref:YycH family regulatory protein n=1 Tax=Alteribacter populi TaxID=2011011 RepID=UPI000BBA5C3F|nr:two-component system activity regulator YycH [Alteribacter populi]
MAIEHFKTALLWVLILTSVGLTYSIWTFQPEFSPLEPQDSIESPEIGEEAGIENLVTPSSIVVHDDDLHYWLEPDEIRFQAQMDALTEIEFQKPRDISISRVPLLNQEDRAVDYTFSAPIPKEVMESMFNFEDDFFPLESVDRIYLSQSNTSSRSEILARFISFEEESIVQADTNLTAGNLAALYEGEQNHLYLAEGISFEEGLFNYAYLPEDPPSMKKLTFNTSPISEQSFIRIFFSDPDFVQTYSRGSREQSYTDGTRFLNVSLSTLGNVFEYNYPVVRDNADENENHIVTTALDYVNAHGGWTESYTMDNWQHTDITETIRYRLLMEQFPVLNGSANQDLYFTKEVARTGTQFERFERPLFKLDSDPLGNDDMVQLEPLDDVLDFLSSSELFDEEDVANIRIGYYMDNTGSLVIFSPSWFVYMNGQWSTFDELVEREEEYLEEDLVPEGGSEDGLEQG